ncbi:MAG: DNA polymerase I [Candidatus Moraniibacteriota bacterium]
MRYAFGMKETTPTLVILDGNALIHRAYHALPPLTSKSGELVNSVYGVALTLLSVLEKFHPEYIAASFDLAGPTFRHEKFADYKATRVKAPDELYAQIPRVKELMRAFNIPIYEKEGFEADDCVGTLAQQATQQDVALRTIIVTGDNDALQLVSDCVNVFALRKGVKDTVLYDEAGVVAKYGFSPRTLIEFKGLRGDTSDNIPGVRGIGEKGATELLKKYGTLDVIYEHLDEISPSVRAKLESGRESAFLSRELGTIDTNAPVTLDLEACRVRDFDRKVVETFFRELGFFSLVKKIPGNGTGSSEEDVDTKNAFGKILTKQKERELFFEQCASADRITFLILPEKGTLFQTSAFACDITFAKKGERGSARVVFDAESRKFFKGFFESVIPKTTYDAKAAMKILETVGIELRNVDFDCLLAGYLLNAGGTVSLSALAIEYAGDAGSTENEGSSALVQTLREKLLEKLQEIAREQKKGKTILDIFSQVEMPLIVILRKMERAGIQLNGSILTTLSKEMEKEVGNIQKEIFTLAGREFNVGSPKQLSEMLFVELKIPTTNLKRTKTNISTASSELEKLKDEYPIVALVEQYRERTKLKNTYLDVLPRLVDSESRLHTTFGQATAATGRLSSTEPNLQNIPIRSEWGQWIRSAFVASSGRLLVGADYSQIELRVAAHLSNDAEMCAAFRRGEDIHRRTASLVYGVSPESVTDDMRRKAKAFNFGIIYGMGAYGLSQSAGMTREEAGKFIEEYLEHFSGIRAFMELMKKFAMKKGYVETELGRRRFLPEMASDNRQIVASAERMAINMPVQGLEADIVKLAMIAVDKFIQERFRGKSTLLLQIHDELIFEVEESVAPVFAHEVKEVMESVYALSVPLIADVSVGKNWGEI